MREYPNVRDDLWKRAFEGEAKWQFKFVIAPGLAASASSVAAASPRAPETVDDAACEPAKKARVVKTSVPVSSSTPSRLCYSRECVTSVCTYKKCKFSHLCATCLVVDHSCLANGTWDVTKAVQH